ncbi:MAG TPA: DUF934 domain-containing protein [Methylomirabilota bacterium]|nr:DUF934 domain-containing protein [Methylomirabilota bacterium]
MPLIRTTGPVEDPWTTLKDEDPLPADGAIIVTLARWQANRDALLARPGPLGIFLKSDQPPSLIAADIERFDVIALNFPKFTNGRAYSSARLLRERYGYRGELRAVGNVLRDQLQFMLRCGFDSFEISETADVTAWLKAFRDFSLAYQPAADARTPVTALRQRPAPARRIDHDEEDAPPARRSDDDAAAEASVVCAGYWAY